MRPKIFYKKFFHRPMNAQNFRYVFKRKLCHLKIEKNFGIYISKLSYLKEYTCAIELKACNIKEIRKFYYF